MNLASGNGSYISLMSYHFIFYVQSITITVWTSAHHVFVVKMFFNIDESVNATQRMFLVHFMLHWNDAVVDRIFNP